MAWFSSETDTPAEWIIIFLGLIIWRGFNAMQPHIDAMVSSAFCYLPRIIPGPTALHDLETALQSCPTIPTMPVGACHLEDSPDQEGVRDRIYAVSQEMKTDENNIPLSLHYWHVWYQPGWMSLWSYPKLERYEGDQYVRVAPEAASTKLRDALRRICPTEILVLLSFFITAGLLAFSAIRQDGPAVTGLVLVSLHPVVTTHSRRARTISYAKREMQRSLPIVLKTPSGAIWVAICDGVAEKAIFNGKFVDLGSHNTLMSFETNLLFSFLRVPCLAISFILFTNAQFASQVAITLAYILLTVLFSVVRPGIGPGEIKISRLYHPLALDAHLPKLHQRRTEMQPSLARTVWYAIRLTRSTRWVRSIEALPRNPGWDEWLREAERNIGSDDWPAEGEKRRLVDGDQSVYLVVEDSPGEVQEDRIDIVPVHESQW